MTSLKKELKQALKELNVATKDDIPTKGDIKEIVENVFHEQITAYHHDLVIPEINGLKGDINILKEKDDAIINALKKLKDIVDELKTKISFIKSEIKNLKVDMTFYATKKEFEKFKSQVL